MNFAGKFSLRVLAAILFFGGLSASGATGNRVDDEWLREAMRRCSVPKADEKVLYSTEFKWGMSMQDMKDKFADVYASGKRLKARAYFDEPSGRFILPHSTSTSTQKVRLTSQFLKSVKLHVEEALKNHYIDYVMFPDMGHSHLLLPKSFYDREVRPRPVSEMHLAYEAMLASPAVKILYHTAEQLKVIDENKELLPDRHLQWRFYTRNLVGDNRGEGQMEIFRALNTGANTAGEEHAHGAHW